MGIALSGKLQLKLATIASATFQKDTKATLIEGSTGTPPPGSVINLPQNTAAQLLGDTKVTLSRETQIELFDGTLATLPLGIEVLVLNGTEIVILGGTQITLLRSKPEPKLYADIFSVYKPSELVKRPYPVSDLDFTSSGAYSVYNWELFFHVPITIAIHLSKNQRFAEAQKWFHFIFDPTDDSDGPTPERFWKVRPFQYTDVKKIEEILVNLSTGADETLRNDTINSIEAWKDAPFRPHVIARFRQQAYMYKTVMAYLDNLIAWGDSLFRQDTSETIDEALMLYVLAASILGPRPQSVPKKGNVRPQTYANLRVDLDKFGNAMRDMEPDIPFDLMPFPAANGTNFERLGTLRSLGKALYFCVPHNDKLLSYWDTVADRLFKIRNSVNFQGIFRQLALFEPRIDPAMLARAAASGLDIGAIVNGLNQPLPLVRFQVLVQKAAEIVQEVKSLGNSLLSAMEKEDGEAMTILRAKHERIIMEMVEHVKYGQLQEAIKSKEGLLKSLAIEIQSYTYYERQLGRKPDEILKGIPELGELDRDSLDKMKFSMNEPEVGQKKIEDLEVDIAADLEASGGKIISSYEAEELKKLELAWALPEVAKGLKESAKYLRKIPDFPINLHFWGIGATVIFGGTGLAEWANYAAEAALNVVETLKFEANRASKIGTYARRMQDWDYQSIQAAGRISQVFKQIRAAQIREAIAEIELKNHRQQMKHTQEIEDFLNEEGNSKNGKKTNKALYTWMKREVKGLYAQCFQFSFDIAKKAERALQHELGNPELNFLQFGYLSGKEGLLAGEKLYLDIKRMEMAYHDLNQREYELTKHVSLLQVSPLELLKLRTTGRCTVVLPEELFDIDCPGHYFRRIKNVAVSIPCVTGPYTSVNCTLTLTKSSIRKSPLLRDSNYARENSEDDRFSDYFGSLQSIVTSTGQNDSGLFETNLRDERYLPFEGSGVISEWQLQLPANPSNKDPLQFDYNTITDALLHIRYTAREAGGLLKNGAITNLTDQINAAQTVGSVRLFSLRHEFPTEWAKFKGIKIDSAIPDAELTLDIREEHFPYWSKGRLESIKESTFYKQGSTGVVTETPSSSEVAVLTPESDGTITTAILDTSDITLPKPLDKSTLRLKLRFNTNSMEDLWLALTWGKKE
ncbi:insecticidal toxin protein [Cyanobacteria bacterium FACHB-63]|nr:insecticidal toxin protein [Cyanobacteria bacterium FACHB-63]